MLELYKLGKQQYNKAIKKINYWKYRNLLQNIVDKYDKHLNFKQECIMAKELLKI
jgi:hypothetical protein